MRIALAVVLVLVSSSCSRRYEQIARDTFRAKQQCTEDVEVTERLEYKGKDLWRTEGCGQVLECRFIDEYETKMSCDWPHDVDMLKQRLSLETGCSEQQMEATKQQRLVKNLTDGRGRDEQIETLVAYRIEACGKAYTCTVNRDSIDCKVALDSAVAPPAEVRTSAPP